MSTELLTRGGLLGLFGFFDVFGLFALLGLLAFSEDSWSELPLRLAFRSKQLAHLEL